MKRQQTYLIRDLYLEYIKNYDNSIIKKIILKWANDLNRQFSKDTQIANKHMKRCRISSVIKEMQIKSAMKYYFTLTGTAINKQTKKQKQNKKH